MRLTGKLLRLLGRVFNKDPAPFLALRLDYDGGMVWKVEDAVLTTVVVGGSGVGLTVDLSDHTIGTLVTYLVGQPGYSVPYAETGELSLLSARVLLDGSKSIDTPNGDHLRGYTSVLWAWLESAATELRAARLAIEQMLLQLSTTTASDVWLDELGSYYGVPRLVGEFDASYGPRIIAEVLRPRGNNVAMEVAIKVFTGQDTEVTDADAFTELATPRFNGAWTFNGAFNFDAETTPLYGLFDVRYGYDLENGGSFLEFQTVITGLINRLRDAGTQLRSLTLTGSSLTDQVAAVVDGILTLAVHVGLEDTPDEPTEVFASRARLEPMGDLVDARDEELGLNISYNFLFNGVRRFNGSIAFVGASSASETI